jgi:hypothetical protein
MANNNEFNRVEHQRCESSSGFVHNIVSNLQLSNNKRRNKMAVKIGWIIVDWLGIPLSLLGIYLNLDNVKSAIIAILAIVYLMMRAYFYFVQKKQAVREKEIALWHLEVDKLERAEKRKLNPGK